MVLTMCGACLWCCAGHLAYHGWEQQGMDIDEEEEDNEAYQEEEDEFGEEGEEVRY